MIKFNKSRNIRRIVESVKDPHELILSLVDFGSIDADDMLVACVSEMSDAECKRVLHQLDLVPEDDAEIDDAEIDDAEIDDAEIDDAEIDDVEIDDAEIDDKDLDEDDDDDDDEDDKNDETEVELESRIRKLERRLYRRG